MLFRRLLFKPTQFSPISSHFICNRYFSATSNDYKVLGINKRGITIQKLNSRFVELSKIYHPDISSKEDSLEKFIEIRTAFENIRNELKQKAKDKSHRFNKTKSKYERNNENNFDQSSGFQSFKNQSNLRKRRIYDFKTEEEFIYYQIFGIPFDTDPLQFFLKSNKDKREIFRERITKLHQEEYKTGMTDEEFIKTAFRTQFVTPDSTIQLHSEKNLNNWVLLGFAATSFVGLCYLIYDEYKKRSELESQVRTYSKEELSHLRDRGWQVEYDMRQGRIDKLEAELPRMIKYPDSDVSANEMLTDYTIWQDIDVYSTFLNNIDRRPAFRKALINGEHGVPRSRITNHKTGLYISIALEAEKRMKSIFVDM